VFGRLAGYEDVNDADRLAYDPAMRAVVGRTGLDRQAASTSQMGRFETGWLASEANLTALADLCGAWIDRVHARRPQTTIVLDMDSSVSETQGRRRAVPTTAISVAPATTRFSCSTSSATWSGVAFAPATRTAPPTGATCWNPLRGVTGTG
jgi:Transposase DDE domain group 1